MPVLYWTKARSGTLTLPALPARPSPTPGGKPIPATGVRYVQFSNNKASVAQADFETIKRIYAKMFTYGELREWTPEPSKQPVAADVGSIRKVKIRRPPDEDMEELHAFCLPDGARELLKGDGQRSARELLKLAAAGKFKELPPPFRQTASPEEREQ